MLPFNNLINVDKDLSTPVYLQIANSLVTQIRQGVLKPGSPLPASRQLAEILNVHRKTVIAAYDELDAQSWVDVYPRKGIFVARHLPEVSPRKLAAAMAGRTKAGALPGSAGASSIGAPYPQKTFFEVAENPLLSSPPFTGYPPGHLVFNDGFPDTRLVPVDLLVREYRRFGSYRFTSKYLTYGPEQGSENLRTEIARLLAESRGLQVSPENILITKGAQMALYLCARVLLSAGDVVIAGDPGYTGASETFAQAGGKITLVPVDGQGIDLDAVEAICKKKKPRLLYVIPHHHNPTTVTLSSERRMQLLELAMKYRFAIVEDDYDYDFQYSCGPILPLASADHGGNVIYVGSFCKILAPGIRIGFMVAPHNLILQAMRLRKIIDRQGEQLLEEAMANLLKNGDIGRHLKKTNKIYHERRDLLCGLLQEQLGEQVSFRTPDGGFAVWMHYRNGLQPAVVAEKASRLGLSISRGDQYFHDPSHPNTGVRLGFASLNPKELETAVGLLSKAMMAAR